MELTVLALSFTLLLILGVPVAFAIGLSSVAMKNCDSPSPGIGPGK